MTRHDLQMALRILVLLVVVGIGLGYAIGKLTQRDAPPRMTEAPAAPQAFRGPSEETGITVPDYQKIYVNDYADLLDTDAETRIRDWIEELYGATGIELTVLTIGAMQDYGHTGAIEPFATALFNTWGIGDATRNDGILILVARYDRQMRIELGAGYSRDKDDVAARIIDRVFLPNFRRDDYQTGILDGTRETILRFGGAYPGDFDRPAVIRGWSWIWHQLARLGEWALALVLLPIGAAVAWARRYLRNRPRPCSRCGTTMLRAGETADDEHLDGGQRLEEYLESVDYDVWHCPSCAHMTISRHPAWFSSHSTCQKCGYRTLETTSTVLRAATTTSTGSKRVDYDCKNCGYTASETRTIPKVSESSSGTGRSSFGGGSSSGGGASGSW